MEFVVFVLAVLGFLASLRLILRSAMSVLRRGVDVFISRELGEAHARRGDLTALQAADQAVSKARRSRRFALMRLGLALGSLIVPLLTPWPQFVYAAYSPLWLLPRRAAPVPGQ